MGTILDKCNEENDERLDKIRKLKHEVIQYLDEQDIHHSDGELLKSLCLKAAGADYSFSDEMYEPATAEFLPTSQEVEDYKRKWQPPRAMGCMPMVILAFGVIIYVIL